MERRHLIGLDFTGKSFFFKETLLLQFKVVIHNDENYTFHILKGRIIYHSD